MKSVLLDVPRPEASHNNMDRFSWFVFLEVQLDNWNSETYLIAVWYRKGAKSNTDVLLLLWRVGEKYFTS